MIRFFGSEAGKAVVFVIVVTIILVFALEFRTGSGASTASLKTECAVSYRGNCVDAKDYNAAYGVAVRGVQQKYARSIGLKKKVLDGLAERELLVEQAERFGIGVSEAAVEQELTQGRARLSLPAEGAELTAFQLGLCRMGPSGGCTPGTVGVRQLRVTRTAAEGFDYKLYEREIRLTANRGAREFRTTQERELQAERMRELVRSRARVSESEAFALFERERSRVVIRSVTLDRSWFTRFAIDTSDATVDTWAATNALQIDEAWKADKDKFSAGCPIVSELTVALPPNASDDEKKPLVEQAKALRQRIEKGEAFAAVARELGSGPSASFGGRVGCLNASFGLGFETLLAAAQKLAPGALSDVLETPRGLHVIRRDGTLEAATLEKEARRQLARHLYAKSAADEAMRAYANKLIADTKGGAKLEDAARILNHQIAEKFGAKPKAAADKELIAPALLAPDRPRFEVSTPFSISGNPLPDVDANEPVAARAFELAAADAVYEKPIETASGLLVIQLKEKMPVSREEFDKDKGERLAQLRQAKGSDALARYVAELRKAAGDKLKIDARFAEESKAESVE